MARKSPRQIRKIRSVGSILVGGWIRGTRTSFNEKFSVFVASRRRQPTKIIARSMVSPVSCKVHATRNRVAVSESSFPRFRCTAFLQTYYYRLPSSTPIFANRAMNYSSNRSATDTSCSSAFFTSYDSSR